MQTKTQSNGTEIHEDRETMPRICRAIGHHWTYDGPFDPGHGQHINRYHCEECEATMDEPQEAPKH